MGDFQQIFQHYISEIKTVLILAQLAGRIEKYHFEVMFSSSKAVPSQRNPQDERLCQALLSILLTVQKMISELSRPELEDPYPSEICSGERDSSPAAKRLCNDQDPSVAVLRQICPTDVRSRDRRRLDCANRVGQVNGCQSQSGGEECLSPQHPTTKETEAANVLVNLSGKAADRVSRGRVEPCVQSRTLSGLDGESMAFLLPAGSAVSKLDLEIKRDRVSCDEVPQINEMDLLPLATEVLCQFCSRQCEDLVELHEHVLAVHNVPDGEPQSMLSVKRLETSGKEDMEEEGGTLNYMTSSETQRETLSRNCLSHATGVVPPRLGLDVQGLQIKQEQLAEEGKVVIKRGKHKSAPYSLSFDDYQQHLNGLLHHSEEKTMNRDVSHRSEDSQQHLNGLLHHSEGEIMNRDVSHRSKDSQQHLNGLLHHSEEKTTNRDLLHSSEDSQQYLNGLLHHSEGKTTNRDLLHSSEDSQQHLNGLLHHSEGKTTNRDVSHQVVKTIRVIVPPKDGAARSSELGPLVSERQQFRTITVGGEREKQSKNKSGVVLASDRLHADVPEQVPVVNDALAIAVESSQIRIIEAKVVILVCLKCSWGYTHAQEYRNHVCSADQPIVKTCPDGSVVLTDSPRVCDDRHQLSNSNIWYFPEFLIRQTQDCDKQGVQNLEIIHCTSGRKLQLFTRHEASYLSEQFIAFWCPTCEKDCDSLNRFLEHLTAGPCLFRCPECNLVYKAQDKLQNHRSSMHPNVEDRTCPNCHMVFEKRHQRNKHLKTKCSKNHMCGVCGRIVKNEYNLRVHMQSHQEREHVCKECGASFYRRTILLRHMMRHSGTKRHACTLCCAKFFTRQHLNTHIDRHNGFKRYSCSACCKAYYSKQDRDSHFLKIHNRASSACQKVSKVNDEEFNDEPLVEQM